MGESVPTQRDFARLLLLLTTVAVVAVVIFVRVRLLDVPLERDEGEYAYIGHLILRGVPPYLQAYSMKLPGAHTAYALIMWVFGETPRGIHIGLLLVNLATIVLLYFLGRKMFDDIAAAAAASAYAVLSLSPSVLGVFAHATHFVVFPMVGGALLFFKAVEKQRSFFFFPTGMLFGLAFLMKQHGIFFVLLGGSWLALELLRQHFGAKQLMASGAWFALGASLPFILVCTFFALLGIFQHFWFWTFAYARAYVTEIPIELGVRYFVHKLSVVAGAALPIWALSFIGLIAPLWDHKVRVRGPVTILFLVFSSLAICPGFYFREHYFIMVLPVVAILVGAALSAMQRVVKRWNPAGVVSIASVFVFIASMLFTVWTERDYYFTMKPPEVSRAIYGPNPFPESVVIGSWIGASSNPDDLVAVLGSEPQIFFYSGRRSATGHIYMYGLMETQPFASLMQREVIQEIEAARPKYVVLVNVYFSWLPRPGSDRSIFQWMQEYVGVRYDRVGVVDILSKNYTEYVWGKDAANYQPRSPSYILLFERKAG